MSDRRPIATPIDSERGDAFVADRRVLDLVGDGIYQLDAGGRFVAVNDVIVELTGFDREALLGTHVSRLLSMEDCRRIEEEITNRLRGEGEEELFEFAARAADGELIPCELRFTILAEDGEFYGTVGVVRDITDRSRVERLRRDRDHQRERERALEEYRTLTQAASDVVVTTDTAGTIRTINPAVRDVFGYRPADLIETSLASLFDGSLPWDPDEPSSISGHTECPGYDEDGSPLTLSISANLVRFEGESYVTSIIRDVTAQRQLEGEQRLFRTLLDHSTDSVLVIDPDTAEYLDVNSSACERRGYTREELLSLTVMDLSEDVSDLETWHRLVAELREVGYRTVTVEHRRKDGSTYPSEFNVTYIELDRPYVLAIARDMTERQERQRRLERSERRYRTLAEHFPNGVVGVYDEELRFSVAAGELAEDVLPDGVDAEGHRVCDLFPEGVCDEVVPVLRAAIEQGETETVRLSFGDRHWQLWATPLDDEDGEIFAGMCFAQNITERIDRQRQLEESNAQLEQFAYAASHDLQEPLRMVASYLTLIENRYGDALDADGREFLDFAVDGADRMREMVDGLLEYSRVETQGAAFDAVDLNTVIDDVLVDLQLQLTEHDAQLDIDELPRVYGDGSQLRQVFQNLIENALAYSGDDAPTITIAATVEDADVALAVSDTGIGIPPEERERVFELFHRYDPDGTRSGTGLGLALCQRIVERHGGEIWADEAPHGGAAIRFSLPHAAEAQ